VPEEPEELVVLLVPEEQERMNKKDRPAINSPDIFINALSLAFLLLIRDISPPFNGFQSLSLQFPSSGKGITFRTPSSGDSGPEGEAVDEG
jgi:hypothetical protein